MSYTSFRVHRYKTSKTKTPCPLFGAPFLAPSTLRRHGSSELAATREARAAAAPGPFLVSLGLAQKAWAWVGASTATAAAGRLRLRGRILQARSWGVGPLGPVESAAAFRIYYLPFVEPLDIDGNLLDQLFGGWFGPVAPLLLGVLVFWIQGQINAVRREQEGKVLSSAAKAVGSAASGAASRRR